MMLRKENILENVVEVGDRDAAAEIFPEQREVRPESFDKIGRGVVGRQSGRGRRLFRRWSDKFERLPAIAGRDVFSLILGPIGTECHRASPCDDIL